MKRKPRYITSQQSFARNVRTVRTVHLGRNDLEWSKPDSEREGVNHFGLEFVPQF